MKSKLYIYRIVDIADEIDINELKDHFSKFQLRPLKLSHFTPAYLNFSIPPAETKEKSWLLLPENKIVNTQIKFYSLGSLTIRYEIEIEEKSYLEIVGKAGKIINNSSPFDIRTKKITKKSKILIEKSLGTKTYDGFLEDYAILWICDKYKDEENLSIKKLLSPFLRNENVGLSAYEENEAFKYNFSYTPDDLTVIDWDRSVTISENPEEDVWDVLEYTNLQLLQLRYYEKKLDERLDEIYDFSGQNKFSILNIYRMRSMLKKTLQIYTEFSNIEKKLDSFLKLTGDEYLSRIYTAASNRLNLKRTQEILKERLVDTRELYGMLSAEASSVRAEILEIIIIILIAFEIISF